MSGELLGHEAQDVMATRLHDAAHAVAYERKVQDTSWAGATTTPGTGRWRPTWDARSSGPAPSDGPRHRSWPYAEIARASIHDSDARLGRILAAVERAGVWDRTAFFVLADLGLEDSNPDVAGDWARPLAAAGIPYRGDAYGFIYVDV